MRSHKPEKLTQITVGQVEATVRLDFQAHTLHGRRGLWATIETTEPSMISLINVFTVDPANQRRLLDLLARATDEFVSRAPGFISSTLHRGLDGTKVTMYAQWRSAEDYESMRRDPGPLPFLEEALTIAKFEPGMYEIVRTFSPSDG